MPSALHTALLFLINTVFDLYLFVLALRLILVWSGAHYQNPLVQFVVAFTDVLVKPLRRYLPNYHGIEFATVSLILLIDIIRFFIVVWLDIKFPHLPGIIIMAMGDFLKLILNTLFYAIFLQVIISWIQPTSYMNTMLSQITAPLMRPFQKHIPPVNGFDLSPIPALIILQLFIILLATPIINLGLGVAL